ncbi:hypothetical protein Clacol_007177 [Clathrus columnatus]|uniref:RING-type domain-containing protein n=1 Tax=Clathrus columnatus TaxID=1419009 RepID=A0AAV5AF90_9AGAM|nr:hypothetical protein Clacol_007177 [Clathrus columnatus]
MLIAHASSTCDVCLDTYSEGVSYHTIPCATNPSRCPLCRHEFSVHNMRKLHFTLPSSRDHFARLLELKLVQSSPDMTLAESLSLFQEVQEWLEGQSEEEFLVLRAFAAVLCGFHEIKDKLSVTENNFNQFRTEATEKEDDLRRSLEEARNTSNLHIDDYKRYYREAKAVLSQLETETELLQSQLDQYREREKQAQSTLEGVRTLYQTAKLELVSVRDECTDLRSQIIKYQEAEQKRVAQYRDYYNKIQAYIQTQVQAQVQAQTQSLVKAAEARAHRDSRRQSNPLPPPPKQVEIPFIKYMAKSTAARRASIAMNEHEEERRNSQSPSKASSSKLPPESDPMTSAFVPTLVGAYSSSRRYSGNESDGHAEVTTLVFKPPKRIPLWEDSSAEQTNSSSRFASDRQIDASREAQRSITSQAHAHDEMSADEHEQSESTPTQNPPPALPSKAHARPSYITYDEYISYEDPPYVEKYPGWGGAGFVSPFGYHQAYPAPVQEPARSAPRPSVKQQPEVAPSPSPRRVSSPQAFPLSRNHEWGDRQDTARRTRSRTQSQSQSQQPTAEDASTDYDYYHDRRYAPPPPTVVRFRYPSNIPSNDSSEESRYDNRPVHSNSRDESYIYPSSRRMVVEEEI